MVVCTSDHPWRGGGASEKDCRPHSSSSSTPPLRPRQTRRGRVTREGEKFERLFTPFISSPPAHYLLPRGRGKGRTTRWLVCSPPSLPVLLPLAPGLGLDVFEGFEAGRERGQHGDRLLLVWLAGWPRFPPNERPEVGFRPPLQFY